jgi:putative membrane protein
VSGPSTTLPEPLLPQLSRIRPAAAAVLVVGVSTLACAGLLLLVYEIGGAESGTLGFLPWVNAVCNAVSATLLVVGVRAVRRGDVTRHTRAMLGAFAASTVFLVGYLVHHAVEGDSRFDGPDLVRIPYLVILTVHVVLSIVSLPMVLGTLWAALAGRYDGHRRLARRTYPVWLTVGVTGVLVVLLLETVGR